MATGVTRNTGKLSTPVYLTGGAVDVEIGDVTVNNAAGGSAVNIQDGGNIITVDGTVTVANDNGATSTTSSVASNVISVTLKAANTSRVKLVVFHDDVASTLFIKEGATASSTDFTYKLLPGDTLIIDDYTGLVAGIWSAATGNARITETV